MPVDYDFADIFAIKALSGGTATAEQQQRAMHWLLYKLCDYDGEPFRSDVDGGCRDTDYALGMRSVARQVLKIINMRADVIAAMRKKAAMRENNG